MVKLDADEEKALDEAAEIVHKAHVDAEKAVDVSKEELSRALSRVSELLRIVQV
jgi:hypothetical protein